MSQDSFDVIVIGSGPGGATSALQLARAGLRVVVLEKSQFPRFHIGESILPRLTPLIEELGLAESLKKLPQMLKLGAEFSMGDGGKSTQFTFAQGLLPSFPTFNIERELFDDMLMREAKAAGAQVREDCLVREISRLEDGAVRIVAGDQTLQAKYLIDASGHGTVVARHLGLRKNFDDPNLQKVAYFGHFRDVYRLPGVTAGYPTILMSDEGWFWFIPLNEQVTSIGFVTSPQLTKKIGVPANEMLAWAISRTPVARERLKKASGPKTNQVLADFSYTCKPIAGPGYFMVGDAGAFLDPIFSTGVTLAMMSAAQAAKHVIAITRGEIAPAKARKDYISYVEGSTAVFWKLIRSYYDHSFRELFLHGMGPCRVHCAVISVLAGQVFPKPVFSLRWRLKFFEFLIALNRFIPLVPRRERFSMLNEPPAEPTSMEVSHEPAPA